MTATTAGSISTGFRPGYAVSLVFFSSLADRAGARRFFLGSAGMSAVSALLFAGFAPSYVSGLIFYTLVALSHARAGWARGRVVRPRPRPGPREGPPRQALTDVIS